MGRDDITPASPKISSKKGFNNRLGRLIEILDIYVKKRNTINYEDIFSLISFSDKAEIIFKNINISYDKPFNLVSKCLDTIEAGGETEFYKGLIEGEKILSKIDRKKYKPVIILFSDGADQKQDETIEIIERVSFYYYIILINLDDEY